jgi:hypothetical protein
MVPFCLLVLFLFVSSPPCCGFQRIMRNADWRVMPKGRLAGPKYKTSLVKLSVHQNSVEPDHVWNRIRHDALQGN